MKINKKKNKKDRIKLLRDCVINKMQVIRCKNSENIRENASYKMKVIHNCYKGRINICKNDVRYSYITIKYIENT